MEEQKNYFFVLRIFNGKDAKYKKYLTLRGVEKRIKEKINEPYRQVNYGAPIVFEGTENNNRLTVFRELK